MEGGLRCGSLTFESRDEKSLVEVIWQHLPNYDSDPDIAIKQIEEDYERETFTDHLGATWTYETKSSKQITLQGQPALRQTIKITNDRPFLWCSSVGYRLIVLPNS